MKRELKDIKDFEESYKKAGTTIFVFTTEWCPDCIFLKTFLDDLVAKYADYDFVLVDTDKFPELASALHILGIPSLIKVRDGQMIDKFISKNRKTKEEIDEFLKG